MMGAHRCRCGLGGDAQCLSPSPPPPCHSWEAWGLWVWDRVTPGNLIGESLGAWGLESGGV